MPSAPFIILPGDVWRIRSPGATDEVEPDRDAIPADIAAAVAARLRQRGYRGQGTLLALPATWCLAATIATGDLPPHDRHAMAFRLEEKLPLPAENFTADFIPAGDGRALGVCVPNEKIQPLVQALEEAGVIVQSIAPVALVALQDWTAHASSAGEPGILVWGERGAGVNVFAIDEHHRPLTWSLLPPQSDQLNLQIELARANLDSDVEPLALDVDPSMSIPDDPRHLDAALDNAAADALGGHTTLWIEFRRGALAVADPLRVVRRPLNAALVAAIVLCVCLITMFLYRGWRYDRLARSYEDQLAAQFHSEFPGWPVPGNVRAVVESERRRLTMLGSSALPAEARQSALRVLHDVLAKVPPDAKVNFDHLTFNEASVELQGHCRAYEDADVLVAAAKSAGMDVPPPQMRKDADGQWSFVVRGNRQPKVQTQDAASAGGIP
ncbi:MAG TPA: GspL/Epsl periplasmic domain-containing protein [Tepidisphaeraceae bacterium]|jgi:type II secretory pathway component PulL